MRQTTAKQKKICKWMQTTEGVAYPKYQTLLGFRMHQIVTDHAGNWCKNWKFTCVIGNLVTLESFSFPFSSSFMRKSFQFFSCETEIFMWTGNQSCQTWTNKWRFWHFHEIFCQFYHFYLVATILCTKPLFKGDDICSVTFTYDLPQLISS